MSDLADNIDPTLPLERVADIADPVARTSSALEAAARWKAEAEKWRSRCEQIAGRELMRQGRREQLYTNYELAHVVTADVDEDGRGNLLTTLKR